MSIRIRKWTTASGIEKTCWMVSYRDLAGRRRHKSFDSKEAAAEAAPLLQTNATGFTQRRRATKAKMLRAVRVSQGGQLLLDRDEIIGRGQLYEKISGIYFLLDEAEIVYVGRSTDIFARLQAHRRRFKFYRFAYVKAPPSICGDLEAAYIKKFQPKYNIAHAQSAAA